MPTEPDAMKSTLYRLPEAREAIAHGAVVAMCDAEKDVDALRRIGLNAVRNPMGAKNWTPALAPLLSGVRDVLVFSDRDAAGEGLAITQCRDLATLTPPARIRRVTLPPTLNGYAVKDIAAYLAAGGTRETLDKLIAAPQEWREEPGAVPGRTRPRSLRDWLSDPNLTTPPAMVVPYLAWQGRVTLFSAREKIGKSTLTGQAVAAATRGGEFLGETVAPCDVLWYGIDEPIGDAARRLSDNGADVDRVFRHDVRPESADDLRSDLAQHPAVRLAVMDTLTELASDKDAQQIATFIRPYVEVARTSGVGLLLIHHTTKAGREYRGSVQLGASVDVKVQLRQPERADADDIDDEPASADGMRYLEGKGRNVSFAVRLQFEAQRYRLGDVPPSLRDRVLTCVRDFGPLTNNELVEQLGARRQNVFNNLRELKTEGLIFAPDKKNTLTPRGRQVTVTSGSGGVVLGTSTGTTASRASSGAGSLDTFAGTDAGSWEPPPVSDKGYPATWDERQDSLNFG